MASSPISPRDLALKEKRFQSVEDSEAAYNIMVRRLNEVYKYNRRDHDRLTEDVAGVGVLLTIEAHTSDDTLTAAESGSIHTNLGASGTITLTLPSSPPVGTYFYFCIEVAFMLRIEPGDGVAIIDTIGAFPGKYKYLTSRGATYGVVFDGSNWAVFNKYASWQEE